MEPRFQRCRFDSEGNFTVKRQNGSVLTIPYAELNLINDLVESDVCLLPNIHEPSIIANLGQRFLNGAYFTEMNGHMIFVNSHTTVAKNSSHDSEIDREPSIDNIAYYALRMMNFYGAPQVIMLKGECGSGKTSCANSIVDYFVKNTLDEDSIT